MHDNLGLEVKKGRQGRIAAMHRPYLKTVLCQKVRDQPCQLLIVLNEQYLAQPQVFHKFSVHNAD